MNAFDVYSYTNFIRSLKRIERVIRSKKLRRWNYVKRLWNTAGGLERNNRTLSLQHDRKKPCCDRNKRPLVYLNFIRFDKILFTLKSLLEVFNSHHYLGPIKKRPVI